MKYYEKIKEKETIYETKLGSESRLHVGKVLAPYNVRPNTVPLVK